MTSQTYTSPTDVLTDTESDFRTAIDEHTRYVEHTYALPAKRAFVLALSQFGVTPETMTEVLDISERMVRQHWSLIQTGGVIPQQYRDVFGTHHPEFSDLGSSDGIWPWPWHHVVTLNYEDPDLGATVRKTVYQDVYFHNHECTDYLVVSETTRQQQGSEKTTYTRSVYPSGESMARQLTSTADTPREYEAAAHVIELAKGDANGLVSPEEVLGLSYDDLPALDGVVSGPHAESVSLFDDTNVTHQPDHIDWGDVYTETTASYPMFEVQRTDHGLKL